MVGVSDSWSIDACKELVRTPLMHPVPRCSILIDYRNIVDRYFIIELT